MRFPVITLVGGLGVLAMRVLGRSSDEVQLLASFTTWSGGIVASYATVQALSLIAWTLGITAPPRHRSTAAVVFLICESVLLVAWGILRWVLL